MKKIAFMLSSMNMGGTEKALLSLLSAMDLKKYEITIFLLEKKGDLLKQVPKKVKVVEIEEYFHIKKYIHESIYFNLKNELKNKKYFRVLVLGCKYLVSKIKNSSVVYYDYISKNIAIDDGNYDIAVAYQGPMNYITYLVSKKINAKKKVAWIHFDIEQMGYTGKMARGLYNEIDNIFVVSRYAKEKFIKEFPKLKDKTEVMLNVVPVGEILKKGKTLENPYETNEDIKILTIGRISNQKGQDIIPMIARKLKSLKINFRWYLIGNVEECDVENPFEILKNKIQEYGVEEEIKYLGVKENPYEWIEHCDIYVQPSRYEGYCTTTNEAKLFCKPIITTDVSGSDEQFKNNETGIIVEFDEEQIFQAIKRVIGNIELRKNLCDNLKKEIINKERECSDIQKFLNL